LELPSSPVVQPPVPTSSVDPELANGLRSLEIGVELRLDIRSEDLKVLKELGAGNGGTVSKVMHIPTKTIMARKKHPR